MPDKDRIRGSEIKGQGQAQEERKKYEQDHGPVLTLPYIQDAG
jgi:hypothetical protein